MPAPATTIFIALHAMGRVRSRRVDQGARVESSLRAHLSTLARRQEALARSRKTIVGKTSREKIRREANTILHSRVRGVHLETLSSVSRGRLRLINRAGGRALDPSRRHRPPHTRQETTMKRTIKSKAKPKSKMQAKKPAARAASMKSAKTTRKAPAKNKAAKKMTKAASASAPKVSAKKKPARKAAKR
jgi:hypothetical protein